MPVRKVSNHGRKNMIGKFPSLKMNRMVQFESSIEWDFIYLLDYVPAIAEFEDQPLVITYEHEGKQRTYTPDFLVVFTNGQHALIECKPEKFVEKEKNQRKAQAAQAWCTAKGWTFHVVTDTDLRSDHRVENVKLLTQHARHEIDVTTQENILDFLKSAPDDVVIADVMATLNPTNPTACILPILHMAYHHQVYIPLNATPITPQSQIASNPYYLRQSASVHNEYRKIFDW